MHAASRIFSHWIISRIHFMWPACASCSKCYVAICCPVHDVWGYTNCIYHFAGLHAPALDRLPRPSPRLHTSPSPAKKGPSLGALAWTSRPANLPTDPFGGQKSLDLGSDAEPHRHTEPHEHTTTATRPVPNSPVIIVRPGETTQTPCPVL